MSYRARCAYPRHWRHRRRQLAAAYRATLYRAGEPPAELCIRIGERHALVDACAQAAGYREWAYLTAANPRSRCLSDAANAVRMDALRQSLAGLPLRLLGGYSEAEAPAVHGVWPVEPGLLVLGCSLPLAKKIGRAFGQLAVLHGRRDEVARLVWLVF